MSEALRIVIVEDDVMIAMDLADLMIGQGHDVCAIAATESEAVAAALRCKPDLMIVDGHLDQGCGVSAMRQVLARGFVPHVYVSGDPRGILEEAPGAVIIDKPFSLRDLEAAIDRARAMTGLASPEAG